MAAELYPSPKFQAFDESGVPLASGKVYTYEPGTTTDRTTWTEAAQDTANANPVILDSRGEADIWFEGAYKIVVTKSDDTAVWTVDNVSREVSSVLDSNGNEVLKLSATASAVNQITITNAATGNAPSIKATGDDTNIDLELDSKGSGTVKILDDISVTDEVRLLDSDASNYVGFTSPATVSSNVIWTLPSTAGSTGDVLSTDGAGVLSFSSSDAGRLLQLDVYTSSDTWTKPSGTTAVLVYVTGGGGGGAGCNLANQGAPGGGAGATAIEYITSGIGSTETITIGAAGSGGSTSGGSGGTGGTSSFGAHCSAVGGTGGALSGSAGGAAGTATGGSINAAGGMGDSGVLADAHGGMGGSSFWGGGGSGGSGDSSGSGGNAFGSGGGGGAKITANRAGGAGAAGLILVFSYS